ncbi:MAG: diguanylate cyclase [Nitrospirae bacterium]|nr:diguanylate cyclase [Nitrospirota bacterium]
MSKTKAEHKIIIATVIAVVSIWTVDSAVNALVLHKGTFLSLLLNAGQNEPFLRILLTLSFIAFGIIIARITARYRRTGDVLRKHSTAIETSMDGITLSDPDETYVYVNQAFATINGYDGPEELTGKSCRLAYSDREYERMRSTVEPVLGKSGRWRGELLALRKNGSTYYQEASITMLDDGSRICIIRDITWRKRSEERLRRSEQFLNTIFDSIRDPFSIVDRNFQIIRVNDAYARMRNKEAGGLVGRKCHEVLQNRASVCEGCVVHATFNSADPCVKEKFITLHDGSGIWVEISTYPILDEDGSVSHAIEYTRDITDRKRSEEEKRLLIEKLEYLSSTDGLTGLMNRRALTDSLLYEIDRAKRYNSELSLILCDIDNFKEINDACGHDAGDQALQTIAAALRTILRKADIAGRYGGDEFMLILPETSVKGAEKIAEKILSVVRNTEMSFMEDKSIRLSLSIGLSSLEVDSDTTDSFIKRTDDAMYASKEGGRDRVSTVKSYPLFP